MEKLILFAYIPLGIACLYRPVLFLYLFLTIPVYEYVPAAIGDFSSLKMFEFGSINIFLWDWLMLMLGIYFLSTIIKKNSKFHATLNTPVSLVILLLFLWEVFISLLSYLKGFEFQNILRNLSVESLLFVALLIPLIDSFDRKEDGLLRFTVLLSILVTAFAILKYTVFNEFEITSSETQRTLAGNAVIILIFPLCYLLYYSSFWRRHSWLTLLFIALTAFGVHFAGHRSGWIVFLFVTGIWFVFQQQKLKFLWVPLWGVSLAVLLVMFAVSVELKSGTFYGDFFIRIADTVDPENQTTQERLSKWKYSFDTLSRNPLLGLGRFPVYTMHVGENQYLAQSFSELNRDPHNLFATKAVHEGLLGLGMLAFFFFVIFRQIEKLSVDEKPFGDFLKVFVIAFLVYSLFNPIFTNETGRIYIFTALGLLNAKILQHAHIKGLSRSRQKEALASAE